jgi:hypothetical protein
MAGIVLLPQLKLNLLPSKELYIERFILTLRMRELSVTAL